MHEIQRQPLAKPGEPNYPWFDRYSFMHILKGMIAHTAGRSINSTVGIAIAWEIAERPLKDHLPEAFPSATQDTLQNMIGDVISTTGGWLLANYLRGKPKRITR